MLTAGALALAVITPVSDQVEHSTETVSTPSHALPATPELADHPLGAEIQKRQLGDSAPDTAEAPWNRLRELRFGAGLEAAPVRDGLEARAEAAVRASRALPRRVVTVARPSARVRLSPVSRRSAVLVRPAARIAERPAARAAERPAARVAGRPAARAAERSAVRYAARVAQRPAVRVAERPAARFAERQVSREIRTARASRPARVQAVQQRRVTLNRGAVQRSARSTAVRGLGSSAGSRDMRAVIAFAKSQVGKRYVRGGEGGSGFDCSGLTKRAYAKAGLNLPHSSGAQARRARSISRAQARPGDLVVGRGHVGIYMGNGMMIDAGNSRTGVVYRKVYRGLSVSRLH